MRISTKSAVVVALAAFLWAPVAGKEPSTLERLAGLGRLWGYIKFTHPWMGRKTKEWDQALVAAIPKVKSAKTAAEYAAAVDHMLSFLGDPVTRRIVGYQRSGDVIGVESIPDQPQPFIEWSDPETAVVTPVTSGDRRQCDPDVPTSRD